jgi:hypothetical protein
VARLCGGGLGAVGLDGVVLFKWVGICFGGACDSGGLWGAGDWRGDLGTGEGATEADVFQLLWIAV